MILGKIFGKTTTTNFKFLANSGAKKFEFVQVYHKEYDYVLCQISELERNEDSLVGKCVVIGYMDDGLIKRPRVPFEPEMEVLKAEDEFISKIIQLYKSKDGAYIGLLEGKSIKVYLDLKKLLTKHIAILAKTGAGKSYAAGVLLEEIMDKKVPLVILDPHGEYAQLKYKNVEDKKLMRKFGIEPRAYSNVREYGDSELDPNIIPLRLNSALSQSELLHLLPKMSSTQTGLLYNAANDISKVKFNELLLNLEMEENNAKFTLMNNIDYLHNLNLFSDSFTSYNEIVQSGRCSIINFKGITPDVQEIIAYKMLKDLFEARKKDQVPPFFLIVEEAHNFCPERSFGETRCSKIIRTIASEGRKFGLGLCVISQRPARIDKSVLSQCTTQIILKITNPNDLKAVYQSVEGITLEAQEEIKNLPIGTALVTGIVDMPLFVDIRPRMTKHGGHTVDILPGAEDGDFFDKVEKFEDKGLLPVIKPKTSLKDLQLMSKRKIKSVDTVLIPAYLFLCQEKNKEFNLLVESIHGRIVLDVENLRVASLPDLGKLSKQELKTLEAAFRLKNFTLPIFISKTGFGMGVKDHLIKLIKLGYLANEGGTIKLTNKYVLSNLSKKACYSKINFSQLNYSKKLNGRISLDNLKTKLSKFVNVMDQRECFIVKYEIKYE
ncbi:ATP-binding protein [Candidatus Woesearchaeota archaeon]|nr:ATP-binding protein [Candidatus Woesearchaeota archaeon]MBL7051222.1 ATP-binding protein [Candidatus Woesearchaeota archaeon]